MEIQWVAHALEIPKCCCSSRVTLYSDPLSSQNHPLSGAVTAELTVPASSGSIQRTDKPKGRQVFEGTRTESLRCLQAALLTRLYHNPTITPARPALTLPMVTITTTTTSENLHPVCRKLAGSSLQG